MIVDRYYYQKLNTKEQAIYRKFYKGLLAHEEVIALPIRGQLPMDVFGRIYAAVTRDNPLIYYVNQSTCKTVTDRHGHTAICPQYFYSREKVRIFNKQIENSINQLAVDLRLFEGSNYDKELKIHDWFCKNIKYDDKGTDIKDLHRVIFSHNIIGVFAKHTAQCEGIAKAVKVLLNAINIKCIVATGKAGIGQKYEPHAWNIADIDGRFCQLDVTWDMGGSTDGNISYEYFNVTDRVIKKTHKAENILPRCR